MNKIFVFIAILISFSVSARTLFKSRGYIASLTYTHIDLGTINLNKSEIEFEIRFSDDGKFCKMKIKDHNFKCLIAKYGNIGIDKEHNIILKHQQVLYFGPSVIKSIIKSSLKINSFYQNRINDLLKSKKPNIGHFVFKTFHKEVTKKVFDKADPDLITMKIIFPNPPEPL